MNGKTQRINWMSVAGTGGLILIVVLTAVGFAAGIFESQESFRQFIINCGLWGPLLFLVFQAVQVVIPVLPGSVGCIAGILAFGPVYGFLYNYIGICAGSILAFLFSRRYGRAFVLKAAGQKKYDKYVGWLNRGKKFQYLFTAAIILPLAPDDFLCLLAGLSNMTLKKMASLILIGKSFVLVGYSVVFSTGLEALLQFLR